MSLYALRYALLATALSVPMLHASATPQSVSAQAGGPIIANAAASASATAAALTLESRSSAWSPQYEGDFDHFAVDTKREKLLLAAEDHGTVEVFDLQTGKHDRTLDTFHTPHAILYLPKQDRFIITDSGKGGPRILDASTYKVIGRIKGAAGADSMAYDSASGRAYIVSGGSDAGMNVCFLNEVDPTSGVVRRRLRFDAGKVEAVAPETNGSRLFVNVADKSLVAVVDRRSLKVVDSWPLPAGLKNLTMALDEAGHRLFVGTRNPDKLLVLNTDTGAVVASLDAPATSDGLFYDATRKRIYVAGGDGKLGVYRQDDANHYTDLGRIATAAGAKSGLLSTPLNRLYLAVSPGDRGKGGGILWLALGR